MITDEAQGCRIPGLYSFHGPGPAIITGPESAMSKQITLTLDDELYGILRDRAGSDAALSKYISDSLRSVAEPNGNVQYASGAKREEVPIPNYKELVEWARKADPNDGWAGDTGNPFEPEGPDNP